MHGMLYCIYQSNTAKGKDQQHVQQWPVFTQETFSLMVLTGLTDMSFPVAREDFPLVSVRNVRGQSGMGL